MILTLAHEAADVGFWSDFMSIATDPAHILAELTFELITGVLLYPIARIVGRHIITKHDSAVHHIEEPA